MRTALYGGLIACLTCVVAAPAPGFVVTVQDEASITCGTPEQRTQALALARKLRASSVRIMANEHGQWSCDPLPAIHAVHAAGFRPQVVVVGDRRYARTLARQVGPLVDTWSVWNEPTLIQFERDPQGYGRLFRRVSRTLRRHDPGARVLIGELTPQAARGIGTAFAYMRQVLRVGRLRADGLAIHPYDWTLRPKRSHPRVGLRRHLTEWRRFLQRRAASKRLCWRQRKGCQPLPIHITEVGYTVPGIAHDASHPTQQIVEWLPAMWRVACEAGVRQMTQYQLVGGSRRWDTAVADDDGPRPQFHTLSREIGRGC
jgi:hypothetical protein